MRLLAGDIGGTNARLVLYDAPDDRDSLLNSEIIGTHTVLCQQYYKNNDYASFSDLLRSFFSHAEISNLKVHSCCFAVAGPVANNRINFTNREGWIIDGNALMKDFNIDSVKLINDFVANGYGLLSLTERDLITLQEGRNPHLTIRNAPVALLGAGTGLGECFLTPDNNGLPTVFPTEGGHVDFAPRTVLEQELLSFIQKQLNTRSDTRPADIDLLPRVSIERLVSGMGLESIYEFLRERHPDQVVERFDAAYNEASEPGALIGKEKDNYRLFKRSLEVMFAIYGGEVGNVALKYLPYGGLYVAGGIAPKNVEFITRQESEFMTRFYDKGRVSHILKEFPVHVVMEEDLGMQGAHNVASQEAAKGL